MSSDFSTNLNTGDPSLDADLAALAPAVCAACEGADAAHDLLHVQRVTRTAIRLCQRESVAPRVPVTAAWLHELFNYPKGHPDSKRSGEVCAEHAAELLRAHRWSEPVVEAVRYAIAVHPFSLAITPTTLEAKILQDADRLDSIGAVGVARCFATCASMGRPFYHPEDPWAVGRPLDDKLWGLDHFALKLERIASVLHTESARAMAHERTLFLRTFCDRLRAEIDGA
ncbi:MAG: HD domain-containing protein [Polyangiales bacterium]